LATPSHLVVVHRTVDSEGDVSLRAVGRLLWFILDAGKFPNIGPDASLDAVQQPLATGEALTQALTGKSLLYGEGTMGGPYRFRPNADGTTAFWRGREPTEFDTGTWSIRDGKFCREWKKIQPRQMCLS
jgi:hypothetical protein